MGRTGDGKVAGWRRARTIRLRSVIDAARAPTRGHRPLWPDVRAKATKKNPNPSPAAKAAGRTYGDRRVGRSAVSRLMRAMAGIATAMPTMAAVDGRSPRANPVTTGTTAETTAVSGATT